MSNGTFTPGTVFLPAEVFYVCLYEEYANDQKFMGKLVVEHGKPETGKSYKPSNTTAAFILYLLFGEGGISYGELIDHIEKKFQGVVKAQIDGFLNYLISKHAISESMSGPPNPNPDPSNICGGRKLPFENPSLANANDSEVRSKIAYGRGQYFYTIRR